MTYELSICCASIVVFIIYSLVLKNLCIRVSNTKAKAINHHYTKLEAAGQHEIRLRSP